MEKQHVLIIDDNQDILTMLTKMLTYKGFTVTARSEAHGLIEELDSITPDVMLMDMLLSGVDGRDVCSAIKKIDSLRHIPLILFSAGTGVRASCLASGADAFIEKPFDMNDLIHIIKHTEANTDS